MFEPGLRVTRSTILAGSDRVTGQVTDPVSIDSGFRSICTRFIVAFEERLRHLGICEIAVVLN